MGAPVPVTSASVGAIRWAAPTALSIQGACRTRSNTRARHFDVWAQRNPEECKARCDENPACLGIEFGKLAEFTRCELITEPVDRIVELQGFICLVKVPGP